MNERIIELKDVVDRDLSPQPWTAGEKIPWDDPAFSERMLKEHLSQDHDLASRRQMLIDRHVAWIHDTCLHGQPARILDLACGPGLYSHALAQRGHTCVGIDFSPASIEYGRSIASRDGLSVQFIQGDLRDVDYGEGFDMAMLIFGEFNVFTRHDAQLLLHKTYNALGIQGLVVLEPQTFGGIQSDGERDACWHTESAGLFSSTPHLWLEEHFWHADYSAATTRYFIVNAETGAVHCYGSTTQAYTDAECDELLNNTGFHSIRRFSSLTGAEEDQHNGLFVLTARKG